MAVRQRRLGRWVIGGVAAVVVLAVAGPFVFIHFIEGPAPAKLSLPAGSSPQATGAGPKPSATAASVDGTWNVGPGSEVGYRVQEVLIGQHATAVGRTSRVWGSLVISATEVTKASFTADMATVVSDQSQRNAQFDGRIMDVSTYPTATFKLTSPVHLSPLPAPGATGQFPAAGVLALHGVSNPVRFTVSAERSGTGVYVLADIRVVFSKWGISNPSIGGFVTTQSSGTLEVLLHLTRGPGNPASSSAPGTSGTSGSSGSPGGSGGPGSGGPGGGGPGGGGPGGGGPGGGGPGGGGPGGGGPGGGGPGGGGPGGGGPGGGGPGGGVTVPRGTVPPLTVPKG